MSTEQTQIWIYKSGLINSDVPTDPVDGSFLDLVAVVSNYATLRFVHGNYQPGDFEITIQKNTRYAAQFQRKRIIQIGTDVYKCGVIETVENTVSQGGAGSEIITIKGRELTSWLDRRVIEPEPGDAYYSLPSTTPAETVVKTLIDACMGPGATNADRIDANLVIETDTALGDDYVVSARYDNLLQVVSNCCLATYSGVFAYLDHTAKTWNIGFSLGVDRTASQSTNPRAVFSTDRGTVGTVTLKDTEQGYRNYALVAGQGEGAARAIVRVPASSPPTGIDRREMFVDARDLTLTPSLENRGAQKLSEAQYVKYLTSDVLAYSQLAYGRDYDVGDEVTIQQFGVSQDTFVTSAEEYWTHGAYSLKIGFDRSAPALPNQVYNALGQMQKTLNATEIPQGLASTDSPTFVTATFTGLTASQAVQTNGSKALVTIANTGTGNNVLATSPTLVTPTLGVASATDLTISSLTASQSVQTDGAKKLVSLANTGSGSNVLATSPTLVTPAITSSTFAAGTATAGTAPLKFASGTNLTAPEAGAVEWDGTNLFITQTTGPTRKTLAFLDSTLTGVWNGTIITSAYGGTGNGFTKFSGPATSEKTFTLPNASATVLTTDNTTYTAAKAAPTGASTTELMMGLAGAVTPRNSTRVLMIISGQMANNTINDGVNVSLRYGTGTAPSNGAALTGTQAGNTQRNNSLVAGQRSGFSIAAVVTGLSVSTPYWIDASVQAVSGGTAEIFGVTISAIEV